MSKRTRDITDIEPEYIKTIILAVGNHGREEIESFEEIDPDRYKNILQDLQIIITNVHSEDMVPKVINFKRAIEIVLGTERGKKITEKKEKLEQLALEIKSQIEYADGNMVNTDSDDSDSEDYPVAVRTRARQRKMGGKYIRKKSSKKKKYTKKLKKHKKKTIKKRKSKKIKSRKRR